MQLETEIKLVCQPRVLKRIVRHPAVRRLKAGRARTERLVSRYFDTPDGALAQNGLALRVRSTPRGWVQTLKGEGTFVAGMQSRPEWEWPVPSNAVSGEVLADTPAVKSMGGKKNLAMALASLVPVFETDFNRTMLPLRFPDGTLAELCVDLGEVRAGSRSEPVSEAEIELRASEEHGAGRAARLFELPLALAESLPVRLGFASKAERGHLLARRTRPDPVKSAPVVLDERMTQAEALRGIAAACMAQMQANESGLIVGRNAEYVHQMRVAIRRLRSAFSVFRQRVSPDMLGPVAAEARALAQRLGAARDWDVFCAETLRPVVQAFPGEPDIARLGRRAARLRRAHDRAAREAVGSLEYTRGLLRLAQLLASAESFVDHLAEPLPAFAAQVLQRRHRRVRKLGERLAELSPEELHRFRISAKKLRYASEFFQSVFPGRRKRAYARSLSGLQDVLGGLNDITTAERLVAELCAKNPPDAQCAGIVRGWLASRRQHHLSKLPEAWARFRDQSRFWKHALPQPEPRQTETEVARP